MNDSEGLSLRDILRARAAVRSKVSDEELLAWADGRYDFRIGGMGGALVLRIHQEGFTPGLKWAAPLTFDAREALDWLDTNTPANRHRGDGRYMLHVPRGAEFYVVARGENLREALHGARALWQE